MNFSRNVSLLKAIDVTLDDKVYVGVTESKGILESIDESLVQIDTVLDSIKLDTGSSTTHLSNIATSTSNADTSLNAIESSATSMDTSLNNMESELDAVHNKLVDIGVTLSSADQFSLTQKYQVLKDSGSNSLLAAGDYSSTTGKLYWQNTQGKAIIVKKVSCTFKSSETTWDKIFTSTASEGDSFLKIGTGDDGTNIDASQGYFNSNFELQPYMSMVFSDPAGGDDMYYSYVIDDLNIKVADNDYFICELSGTFNASGDDGFGAGILYEKSV